MLVLLTLPFYDFCGFRPVAVNSVHKLQFFNLCGLWRVYWSPMSKELFLKKKKKVTPARHTACYFGRANNANAKVKGRGQNWHPNQFGYRFIYIATHPGSRCAKFGLNRLSRCGSDSEHA